MAVTATIRRAIWERDGGICQLCREPVAFEDMEADHVHPRSHGGANDPSNLQTTHEPCNRKKGYQATGYLTTRQAAERLGWSYSRLRSRIGWDGIAVDQYGQGNILIAESEIERIERDGWLAYRQERYRQRFERETPAWMK